MGKPILFGSGNLYGIDRSVAVPTPRKFGILQDVTTEISFTKKELFGQNLYAEASGRSEGKITCKAKYARLNADLMGDLFFGAAPAVGQLLPIIREQAAIPATPFTITVAHGATFDTNLGVIFKATGLPLKRVAAGPVTGEYSLVEATGVYTFAAADTTKVVLIDYLYLSAAAGKTITIVNQEAGLSPSFMAVLTGTFDAQSAVLILNKCISNKLSIPTKRGDFGIQEFDFEAQADDADEIGVLSLPE